jgi:hypothetical protein
MEPGMPESLVAKTAGFTVSQLFQWRKTYTEGSLVAVGANVPVVPASELKHTTERIKQLESDWDPRLWRTTFFGKRWTVPKQKSGLRARRCCPGTTNEAGIA